MHKKIIGMFALLIMTLSVVGFAYATWVDSLEIKGTVHMGDLIVGILDIKEADDNEMEKYPDKPDKWVNDVLVDLFDPEDSVHHTPAVTVFHTMTVRLTVGYPCLKAWVVFDLKNAGSIPVKIKSITVTGYDVKDGEDLTWVDEDADPLTVVGGLEDPTGQFTDPAIVLNLEVWKLPDYVGPGFWGVFEAPIGNQLHPCNDVPVLLWIEVKQEAEECHTYEFTITIEAAQWNWEVCEED